MGKILRGILGGFSGKIGNVVGSSWKGIAVIKSLPLSVANPRTAGQVSQRNDFKDTAQFASKILAVAVKPLWDRFAAQMSGYNAFIAHNISKISAVVGSKVDSFVMSTGKMASTAISEMGQSAGTGILDVIFVDDTGEGLKLATDIGYVVVSLEDGTEVEAFMTGETRSSEQITCVFSRPFVDGEKVSVWLSFLRADGTVVSDSYHTTALGL